MNRRLWHIVCAISIGLSATSCGRGASTGYELQRARSGGIDVVLLSSFDVIKHGKDEAFIEFRSPSDQHLIDVGAVKVSATMSMTGMAPMVGDATVERTDTPGRYAVATDLAMAGSWTLGVQWDGPAGRSAVQMRGNVR